MLVKKEIKLHPDPEIRHLEGSLLMEDDIVGVFDYKVDPDETHLRFFKDDSQFESLVIPGEIIFFGTINNLEVMYLNPAQGQWSIVNVMNPKIEKKGVFPFRSPSPFRARLLFFPESKMMGIWEMGNFEKTDAKFTFMPYPPPAVYNQSECWVHLEPNLFNHQVTPLNLKDRVAYYAGKVDNKIKFHVLDVIRKEHKYFEVDKPESEAQYCLKHVAELKQGIYLLSIQAMKPEFRYVVFDESKPDQPLRSFKTQLSDQVDTIISLGSWLYVLEFKVDGQGQPIENDLTIYSKETELPVFKDKCLIAAGIDYFPTSTNDQFLMRVESEYNCSKEVSIQSLRVPKKILYVHLLKEICGKKMNNDMIQHIIDAFAD